MKVLNKVVAVVAFVVTPIASFAQSSQGLTRAQVREELAQLYDVGYRPLDDRNSYPSHIQAAEARLASQKEAATADTTSFGATTTGSTQNGTRP